MWLLCRVRVVSQHGGMSISEQERAARERARKASGRFGQQPRGKGAEVEVPDPLSAGCAICGHPIGAHLRWGAVRLSGAARRAVPLRLPGRTRRP